MFAIAGMAVAGFLGYQIRYRKGSMDMVEMKLFLQELWKETHRTLSYGKTNLSHIKLFEV